TVFNLQSSFRRDDVSTTPSTLSTYSLAWDQYDPTTQNYSLRFQLFNADGSISSPVSIPAITPSNATSVTVSSNSMPTWAFRSGSGEYVLGIAETNSATNAALNLSGPHQALQFQRYGFDGVADSLRFTIQPNLAAYAPGATNEIIQAATGQNAFPSSRQL